MSGKIIKINDCGHCQYHYMSQLSENVTYCLHEDNQYDVQTGGDPVIPDFPNIPDWCPLEADLTPALDTLQGYLVKGNYINYNSGRVWGGEGIGLYDKNGEEVAFGDTFKELLINLVNLGGQ